MEIDERTGLPKLPDWHFWHVGRRDRAGDYRFSLRVGWTRWFSSELSHAWIYDRLTEDKIRSKAESLYVDWEKKTAHAKEAARLVGSYPPKTLNKKKDTV